MSVISNLSKNGKTGFKKYQFIINIENKAKEVLEYFDHISFIHKIVSLIKILVLRMEVKIDNLLHNIRKEAKIKNGKKQIIK